MARLCQSDTSMLEPSLHSCSPFSKVAQGEVEATDNVSEQAKCHVMFETRSLLDLAGSTSHIMIYTLAGSSKVEQQVGERWRRMKLRSEIERNS